MKDLHAGMGARWRPWLRGERVRSGVLAATVWATVALAHSAALGEWFGDLYIGAAVTQRDEVTLDTPAGEARVASVGFLRSSVFGGRVGRWFDSAPFLGVALDVSHYRPDTAPSLLKRFDLYVTPIAADLMLRWPLLTSPDHPKGRLQPYITMGPALGYIEGKDTTNFFPNNQYQADFFLGAKGGAGLAWQLHPNIALFAEYRFTHFSPRCTSAARTRSAPTSTRTTAWPASRSATEERRSVLPCT